MVDKGGKGVMLLYLCIKRRAIFQLIFDQKSAPYTREIRYAKDPLGSGQEPKMSLKVMHGQSVLEDCSLGQLW